MLRWDAIRLARDPWLSSSMMSCATRSRELTEEILDEHAAKNRKRDRCCAALAGLPAIGRGQVCFPRDSGHVARRCDGAATYLAEVAWGGRLGQIPPADEHSITSARKQVKNSAVQRMLWIECRGSVCFFSLAALAVRTRNARVRFFLTSFFLRPSWCPKEVRQRSHCGWISPRRQS